MVTLVGGWDGAESDLSNIYWNVYSCSVLTDKLFD